MSKRVKQLKADVQYIGVTALVKIRYGNTHVGQIAVRADDWANLQHLIPFDVVNEGVTR